MLSLRSPPWRRDPSKLASGKPGAVQARSPTHGRTGGRFIGRPRGTGLPGSGAAGIVRIVVTPPGAVVIAAVEWHWKNPRRLGPPLETGVSR